MHTPYNLYNFEALFREFLLAENNSEATLKNYLSDLRHFLGWFTFFISSAHESEIGSFTDHVATLSVLDSKAVHSYKTYMESNSLPISSINRRLSTLRKFCSLCIKQQWMKENPAKQIQNAGTFLENVKTNQKTELQTLFPLFEANLLSTNHSKKEISLIKDDVFEFFTITNL